MFCVYLCDPTALVLRSTASVILPWVRVIDANLFDDIRTGYKLSPERAQLLRNSAQPMMVDGARSTIRELYDLWYHHP